MKELGWVMAVFCMATISSICYGPGMKAQTLILPTLEAEAQEYHSTMICQNLLLQADELGLLIFSLENSPESSPGNFSENSLEKSLKNSDVYPSLIAVYPLPGSKYIVAVAGLCPGTAPDKGAERQEQRAYIAYEDGERAAWGLAAIDLTQPSDPRLLWSMDLPSGLADIRVEDRYIYLKGPGGPRIIDRVCPTDQIYDPLQEDNAVFRYSGSILTSSLYTLPSISTFFSPYISSYSTSYSTPYGSPYSSLYTTPYTQTWTSPLTYPVTSLTSSLISSTAGWGNLPGTLATPYVNTYVPSTTTSSSFISSWSPSSLLSQYAGQYPAGGLTASPTIFLNSLFTGPWSLIGASGGGFSGTQNQSNVPIRLPLKNAASVPISGKIDFTLLDLNRKQIDQQQESLTLEPGQKIYALRLRVVPSGTKIEDFGKYILHYQFTGGGVNLSGDKSLFYLADKMEVRINGPDSFFAGEPTYLGVHAFVQGDSAPVDKAEVTVDLIRGNKTESLYRGSTGEEGLAKALLTIPENAQGTAKIKFRVSSSLGTEEITENIEIVRLHKVLLTTDKPLYQPGQTIHIRSLTLQKPDLAPAADQTIIIEVEDSKGNKVFRVGPKTDSFGLAWADFVLGTDINMGIYTIRAVMGEGSGEGSESTTSEKKVTVDRYVLPKFKVDLKTDADYYQPADLVNGTIQTKYLFGKPVTQGKVTVDAYKYDVDFTLFQSISGQTDSEGFFTFDLRLPSYFVGHPLEQGGALVRLDISVKDSANHEEKVSRELTVTNTPITIRLIPESKEIVSGVENIIYLMTTDPTGQGLATLNTISAGSRILQQVSTDEQGLGQFTLTPADLGSDSSTLVLHILSVSVANGSGANRKTSEADIALTGDATARILLRTDKAIYTVGQTMTIDLYTPEVEGRRAFVDIIRDRQTMLTTGVDIVNGHGRLLLDLDSDMAGTIMVEAYYISAVKNTASDVFRDKKMVYVNKPDDIQVSATLDKDQYLPGEPARIDFQVTPAQPAALGITIVDEAVYALQENQPGLLKVFFNMEKEIMTPRFWPLPVPFEDAASNEDPDTEVQDAAQAVFAELEEPPDPALSESSYPQLVDRMKESLSSTIDADATEIVKDLAKLNIYNSYSYKNALTQGNIKQYLDPWGNLYIMEVGSCQLILTSWGPDEMQGTADDLRLTKLYQPPPSPPVYFSSYSAVAYGVGGYGGIYGSSWGGGGGYAAYSSGAGIVGGYSTSQSSGSTGSTEPEIQPGYLTPTTQAGGEGQISVGDGSAETVQEPRKVRRDFPETLLWEPSLITNPNGTAYLNTNMADSITTWRMSTVASTLDGKLGGRTDGIVVFQDFFIDLDLPVTLTQNDEISLPVAVYNYLQEAQTVHVRIEMDQEDQLDQADQIGSSLWFELKDDQEKVLQLEAGQVTSVNFRIKALKVGWHELTVFGYGTRMSDAISRRIEVMPDGMETQVSVSERLQEHDTTQVINIPPDAIDDASRIMVKVYPCLFSQVVEGLDKLFKVPYGCFGQTTAVTWPNVLALDYMMTTKQLTPEIEMKAQGYINLGYQRLLTFECQGGGFDLFGGAKGNPVLTAYGLMEFADMARVQFVDPAMISRTQKWLASQQNTDGSWPPGRGTEFFNALNSNLRATAYATWALIHSGYAADNATVKAGQNYIKTQMKNSSDTYTLAVCANALLEGNPQDKDGLGILDWLEARKIEEGDKVHWTSSEKESITYSRGNYLEIETTGMITYVLLKANCRYPKTIEKALNYIVQKKDASGIWGQVEATVISLKVLIMAMNSPASGVGKDMIGEISVSINGQTLDKDDLPILKITPVDSQILRTIDLQPYTVEGDNTVNLSLTGAGNLLYQITGTYYIPWKNVDLQLSPPLSIDLSYDKKTLTVDDTVFCTVTVKNNVSGSVTQMGMVDLGIPPGFSVLWEDFDQAIEKGKIFKYESTNRQLSLYLHPISFGNPLTITYRLVAKYPLKVSTPKSTAYDYYNPDVKDESKPVVLTVY